MKKTWSFVLAVALAISFLLTACANSSGESGAADLGVDNGVTQDFKGKSASVAASTIKTTTEVATELGSKFVKGYKFAEADPNNKSSSSPSGSMKNYMDIPRSNNSNGAPSNAESFFNEAFSGFRGKLILEILKKETDKITNKLEHDKSVSLNLSLADLSEVKSTLEGDPLWDAHAEGKHGRGNGNVISIDGVTLNTLPNRSKIKKAVYWNRGSYVEIVFEFEDNGTVQYFNSFNGQTLNKWVNVPLDDIFYVRIATTGRKTKGEESNIYAVIQCYERGSNYRKLLQQMQENIVVKDTGVRELKLYTDFGDSSTFEDTNSVLVVADATADNNKGALLKRWEMRGKENDGGFEDRYVSGSDVYYAYDVKSWNETYNSGAPCSEVYKIESNGWNAVSQNKDAELARIKGLFNTVRSNSRLLWSISQGYTNTIANAHWYFNN